MADDLDKKVEFLREKGLTCGKLKAMENRERKDAQLFAKAGLVTNAKANEISAERIKNLRREVCKLR